MIGGKNILRVSGCTAFAVIAVITSTSVPVDAQAVILFCGGAMCAELFHALGKEA